MCLHTTEKMIPICHGEAVLKEASDSKPLTDGCLISEAEKPLKNKKQVNEQGNQDILITE